MQVRFSISSKKRRNPNRIAKTKRRPSFKKLSENLAASVTRCSRGLLPLLKDRNNHARFRQLKPKSDLPLLKKLDPEKKPEATKKSQVATPPAESEPAPPKNRYIPQAIRRSVWKRDQGKCTYVNEKTGVQCGSSHLLEVHHIQDFSLGGKQPQPSCRDPYPWRGIDDESIFERVNPHRDLPSQP